MKLEQGEKSISLDELGEFSFAPQDIYWKRKVQDLRLCQKGQLIDHSYLEKFRKTDSLLYYCERPLYEPILDELSKLLDLLKQSKYPDQRAATQEKLNHVISLALWKGEVHLSTFELVEVFYRHFSKPSSESESLMRQASNDLYSLNCFKASLSCSLAIVFGYGQIHFLTELYRSHFVFFKDSLKNYEWSIHEIVNGKKEDQEKLSEIFKNSLDQGLKDKKDVKYPIILTAMSNILERLTQGDHLGKTSWTNFSDLEEILFFSQKIFYGPFANDPPEYMSDLFKDGQIVFESKNLTAFLNSFVREVKESQQDNVYNPRFIHLLKQRMDQAFDPCDVHLEEQKGA